MSYQEHIYELSGAHDLSGTYNYMYMGYREHMSYQEHIHVRCTMRCEIWAQPAELPR